MGQNNSVWAAMAESQVDHHIFGVASEEQGVWLAVLMTQPLLSSRLLSE